MRPRITVAVLVVVAVFAAWWWLGAPGMAPRAPVTGTAPEAAGEAPSSPRPPTRAAPTQASEAAEDASIPTFAVLVRRLDGSPVEGASVCADLLEPPDDHWGEGDYAPAESPRSVVLPARTGEDGRALLAGAGTGRWRIVVTAAGHARREVATARRVADPVREVVVEVEPAQGLDVVVRDAEGRPAPGTIVHACAWGTRFSLTGWDMVWRATTDASGACRFEDLPAGSVAVSCSEGERGSWTFVRVPEVARVELVAPRTPAERAKATATLEVRAVDLYGSVISGASVRFVQGEDPFETTTTAEGITGDDGVCRVTAVADAYACVEHLVVRKGGWATARVAMSLVQTGAGATRRFDDIVLSPEARISGKVIGPEGPVAGAKVTVWVAADDPFGRMTPEWTKSADDGSWRVGALVAGTVVIEADAPGLDPVDADMYGSVTRGWAPKKDELDAIAASAKAVVVAGTEATHDIRMTRTGPASPIQVTYTGVVRSEHGTPVAWAEVWATGSTDHRHVPDAGRAIAGADGRFSVIAEAAEGFWLYASAPGLRSAEGVDLPAHDSGTHDGVEIVVRAKPVVRGTARSSIGLSVAGARVRFGTHHSYKGAEGVVWDEVPWGLVAADGSFTLPVDVGPRGGGNHDAPWEEWVVCIEAYGHAPAMSPPFTPEDLAAGKRFDVVVGAGAAIAGRVVDGTGAPIVDAPIQLVNDGGGIRHDTWPPRYPPGRGDILAARTAADGSFRIERLFPSNYMVSTSVAGWFPEELRVTAPAPFVELRLRAVLAVAGVVLTPDDEPLAGAVVRLTDPERSDESAYMAATGVDGAFRVADVPEGRWIMTVEPDHDGPDVQPLVAEIDAGATSLRLRTKPAVAIRGTLIGTDGKPLADAEFHVRRMDDAPDPWFGGKTDAAGRFEQTHLAPGRFRVSFDGLAIEFEGVDAPGAPVLRVPGKETLSGTLHDRGGERRPFVAIHARRIDGPAGEPVAIHTGTVAEDSTFTFRDLAPGRYAISVSGTDNDGHTRRAWVADPGTEASAPGGGVVVNVELRDIPQPPENR